MVGNSNNETNFPQNRQILSLTKAFANLTSVDIKLPKVQLTKMQKGGFLKFVKIVKIRTEFIKIYS